MGKKTLTEAQVENIAMRSKTELKPCPFCGGKAIKSAFHWGSISDEYTIKCTVCGASTTVLKLEEAIEAWNNRINI